ncbi:hypothetical protein BD414DRAFT_500208 [Trametes punicea]|nr:hypothetical protein BD414DRAFT_500208 [Trametes punicea]
MCFQVAFRIPCHSLQASLYSSSRAREKESYNLTSNFQLHLAWDMALRTCGEGASALLSELGSRQPASSVLFRLPPIAEVGTPQRLHCTQRADAHAHADAIQWHCGGSARARGGSQLSPTPGLVGAWLAGRMPPISLRDIFRLASNSQFRVTARPEEELNRFRLWAELGPRGCAEETR